MQLDNFLALQHLRSTDTIAIQNHSPAIARKLTFCQRIKLIFCHFSWKPANQEFKTVSFGVQHFFQAHIATHLKSFDQSQLAGLHKTLQVLNNRWSKLGAKSTNICTYLSSQIQAIEGLNRSRLELQQKTKEVPPPTPKPIVLPPADPQVEKALYLGLLGENIVKLYEAQKENRLLEITGNLMNTAREQARRLRLDDPQSKLALHKFLVIDSANDKEVDSQQKERLGLVDQLMRVVDLYKPQADGVIKADKDQKPPFGFAELVDAVHVIATKHLFKTDLTDTCIRPESTISVGGIAVTGEHSQLSSNPLTFYTKYEDNKFYLVTDRKVISQGTFSQVASVWDVVRGSLAAIKTTTLWTDDRKNTKALRKAYGFLKTEFDLLTKLNSVPLVGIQHKPDVLFEIGTKSYSEMMMLGPLYSKGNLADWAKGKTEVQRLALCKKLVVAFQTKEDQLKLWHGDFKPKNIFIDENDNPHIGDLAGARYYEEAASKLKRTTGTTKYIHIKDHIQLNQAIHKEDNKLFAETAHIQDQYALAITLYETLTGTDPYTYCFPKNAPNMPFVNPHDQWDVLKFSKWRYKSVVTKTLERMLAHDLTQRMPYEDVVKFWAALDPQTSVIA